MDIDFTNRPHDIIFSDRKTIHGPVISYYLTQEELELIQLKHPCIKSKQQPMYSIERDKRMQKKMRERDVI